MSLIIRLMGSGILKILLPLSIIGLFVIYNSHLKGEIVELNVLLQQCKIDHFEYIELVKLQELNRLQATLDTENLLDEARRHSLDTAQEKIIIIKNLDPGSCLDEPLPVDFIF